MSRLTKDDWAKWQDEVKAYASRDTQGFSADIKALDEHIGKLWEVCPKDKAGYPHTTSLIYLNRLQQRLDYAKKYLSGVKA